MVDNNNRERREYRMANNEDINNNYWINSIFDWWSGFSLRTKLLAIATLVVSLLMTGITLFVLSVFISNPLLSNAIGVEIASFHVGLVAFGLLYSPISELTGLLMNSISRKFEYQADDFARKTYKAEPLISSLKKLSKNSLSNLTPHKAYVWVHYSHPTLYNRIRNLKG